MAPRPKKFVCCECEAEFSLTYRGKAVPEICPFCGEDIDCLEDLPLLKDFDEYDEFDDVTYYSDDDDDCDA